MTRRNSVRVGVAAACCLVLAGCGSQVPPREFVNAQVGAAGGAVAGAGAGGGAGAAGGTGTGSATGNGAAAGGDAARAGSGGTAAGGGAAGGGAAGGAAGGGSGGGGSGGGAKAGTGSGGGARSGGGAAGSGGAEAASCAGFKNSQGISNSSIKIANASDVSGPVPGLFQSAQQAMKAYVAYFNATASICGRTLSLENLDSQTSSGGDGQAATTACADAFAMVGSMGAFDDGGANTVKNCGIPDLRAASTTGARANVPNVYGVYSLRANLVETAPADFYKKAYPGVDKKAAFLYLNAGASSINAKSEMKGWEHEGYDFVYSAGIPVTEFNYTSYVSAMQSKGVKYVQYVGAYQNAVRLKQAMAQQGFNPLFVMDPTAYDQGYVSSGGSAVEGTHVFIGSETFEDSNKIPEMKLYLQWLQRVAPGAKPSFFGLFAWSAGRLFTDTALKLGGKLTRASLLAALAGIDNYTGYGMLSPQHVGKKITGGCYGFIVLKGGKWVREGPTPFACGPVVDTGIS
jgi:ABC-type branched-subunit amino acid transport system substrate-binding protein